MSTSETIPALKKQNKHLNIEDAIDKLITAKGVVKDLLEEVTGDYEEKTPSAKEERDTVALIYTLDTAGNRVTALAQGIIDLTKRLKEAIF